MCVLQGNIRKNYCRGFLDSHKANQGETLVSGKLDRGEDGEGPDTPFERGRVKGSLSTRPVFKTFIEVVEVMTNGRSLLGRQGNPPPKDPQTPAFDLNPPPGSSKKPEGVTLKGVTLTFPPGRVVNTLIEAVQVVKREGSLLKVSICLPAGPRNYIDIGGGGRQTGGHPSHLPRERRGAPVGSAAPGRPGSSAVPTPPPPTLAIQAVAPPPVATSEYHRIRENPDSRKPKIPSLKSQHRPSRHH